MNRIARLCSTVLLVFACFFALTTPVSAYDANVEIEIQIDVQKDLCPNIPGVQVTIPPGMVQDTEGNCYTPPTPPEPEVDLCLNLPGVQIYIPWGYWRDWEGNCWPQPLPPEPPVDLCPNIPDVQTEIPNGYIFDPVTNTCIPEPTEPVYPDVCHNIPGIQTETPPGMNNEDGYCYTPAPITPQPPEPPVTPEEPPLKNLPNFLQPFGRFLVGLVPPFIQDFFRSLPDDIVYQLPFYILILVLIFILIPIPQSIREYYFKRRLAAFYASEQGIAEEKDNFIALASHYFRTPIAIMKDSLPLLVSTGDVTRESATSMENTLKGLSNEVSTSIDNAGGNPLLNNLDDAATPKVKPFWRSGFFWLPIVLSIVLTLLANFFIGVVGDKEIGGSIAIFQVIIIIVFIVVLYLLVRNYLIQKKLRQEKDALIAHEQAIDSVRNTFLEKQATNLSSAVGALYFTSPSEPPTKPYNLYNDGLSRLSSIHDKFFLLSQVRTGASRDATPFDLQAMIEHTVALKRPAISKKNLVVQTSAESIPIVQNEPLFAFVVSSIIDNAIKYSNDGGQIDISSQLQGKNVTVTVKDNGKGIDPSKVDQLFKPFSRAESAVDSGVEGLGLSLYLNRLILTYTGGNITINPSANGTGTEVTITTPVDVNTVMPSTDPNAKPPGKQV